MVFCHFCEPPPNPVVQKDADFNGAGKKKVCTFPGTLGRSWFDQELAGWMDELRVGRSRRWAWLLLIGGLFVSQPALSPPRDQSGGDGPRPWGLYQTISSGDGCLSWKRILLTADDLLPKVQPPPGFFKSPQHTWSIFSLKGRRLVLRPPAVNQQETDMSYRPSPNTYLSELRSASITAHLLPPLLSIVSVSLHEKEA